ncbi:hypothetical protein BUALT_Bualt08G0080500 [Buddleja alternifolia]|uniref:Uncharacterized protein n=1 Tax=Buddleja alternifolia TaxID=168488 RepID=A0AAV6X685_9LAMI|nr:hypothetical protein BUALT_Bualt08G0080500 [Buddleja alternifolia]
MESERKKGHAWAISAGLNAALAAISAKFFSSQHEVSHRYKLQSRTLQQTFSPLDWLDSFFSRKHYLLRCYANRNWCYSSKQVEH